MGLNPSAGLGIVLIAATTCSGASGGSATPIPTESAAPDAAAIVIVRDANVPELPFADNPDPNACGIPTPFGDYMAWVNGAYMGQLVQPTVLLYDSHERIHITGAVPSGTEVTVELYQANPVLDFYFIRADTPSGPQKGWVPAPFLQFTPPG